MYIPQKQLEILHKLVTPNKVVVIYGPRRCGKTTLLNHYLTSRTTPYQLVSGEDITVREQLGSQSIPALKNFIGDSRFLAIDEAQKIPQVGLNLKLIVDHVPDVCVIATGSSAFDLAHQLGEPLTGRKFTVQLFPIAQLELAGVEARHETIALLETRLRYGSYPEVITAAGDDMRERLLKEIMSSYLFKDILEFDGIRHADKLIQLLRLLAFQIGQEVSYTELGAQLGMSKNTVEKYLDLLEKSFVVLHIRGFSRNLRKEVSKNPRYYFYDVGIRNALINNFNALAQRNDVGMLWENYLLIERMKKQEYHAISANNYFWRTYDQQEIDHIEDRGGELFGYEFTWGERAKKKPPRAWAETYPNASYEILNRENYLDFIA